MGLIATHYQYYRQPQNQDCNKILICAPANAAIDHIVKKLKNEGLIAVGYKSIFPKILRTGAIESNDPEILSVTFDLIC